MSLAAEERGASAADDPAPAPSDETRRTQRRLTFLVFVVGTGSLGAEIAAARLMAPYFGASTIVWANTIGVVLVALSVGYWLGGRFADRRPDEVALRKLVLVAAALVAAIPLVAGPFFELSVKAFDQLNAGAFFGSLFGVLGLVAIPVVLLGAVSPWAIRLAVRSVEEAGEVTGRLYAISTAGSLIGTFVSALVLVPFVGTQRTFIVFGLVIALAALPRLPRKAWLVPLGLAALLALPPGATKPTDDDGERILAERDTEYQYARVVEDPSGERRLELNEGQAVHSLYRPASVLTDNVWDGYLVLPLAGLGGPPRTLAMLGNAGGTVARAYERFFPETRIDGVEIDPEVSDLGREFLGMDNPRLTVHDEDARPFLRRTDARYDAIAVDAYRQPYIPFYLATEEFFRLARSRLNPGGVLMVNVGHPEGTTDLEEVLTAGVRSAFPHVARWEIEDTNTLLVASERPVTPSRLAGGAQGVDPGLQPVALRAAAELEPALETGREPYTDDKAPVEWLIDSSIVEYAAGG